MNPLIITPLYPPAVGGAALHFGQIAPLLAHRPEIKRLTLLTEKMHPEAPLTESGKLTRIRALPLRLSEGQKPFVQHAWSYMQTEIWFARHLPRLIKSHQIDLIHFHTRYAGPLFQHTMKRVNVPLIADAQDKMSRPAELAKFTQSMICCGEGVRQFALQNGYPVQQTYLAPIPFQASRRPDTAEMARVRQTYDLSDEKFILYVGDITPNKGIYELLDGFDRWRRSFSDVKLVMVGVNREQEKFLRVVEQAHQVKYLGHIPHSDVLSLMSAAELMILPSKSEGLPRVILEAIAMGTKVVAPPNIPEFEQHIPNFTLPEVSEEAIAKALESVWHADQMKSYPLDAHEISQIVNQIMGVYQHVLSNSYANLSP